MTVALAGRAPATFEIKSATLPLVALLLKSADLSQLAEELKARFGDMPEFFDHDPLVIDLAPLQGQDVDFTELLHLLRAYRVMPVAVKGGTPAQMEAARVAGLAHAPEAAPTPVASKRPAAESPPPPPVPPTTALVIDKPIRSGQQVYARGRDIVVMAMVNVGGEVIADGNIHVYAPLRGKAIAGARGDETARILTLCLEPELVSIAGIYRTSEHPLPDTLRGKPAQIRLRGDKLAFEGLIP
jgi:septum site-determining protein MinC